jgi:hypothetical protein
MNHNLHPIGCIVTGGTVFDITIDINSRAWAASPVGLFRKQSESWYPVHRGMPFIQVSQLNPSEKPLLRQQIKSSFKLRPPWKAFDQFTGHTVISFVHSPIFKDDHTLYALTSDGQILFLHS